MPQLPPRLDFEDTAQLARSSFVRRVQALRDYVEVLSTSTEATIFESRAAFEAASPGPGVTEWALLHNQQILWYVRDPAGTAIESANGVRGSPAGVPTLAHWPATLEGFRDACAFADGGVLEVPAGDWALHLPAGSTIASVDNLRVVGTSRSDSRIVVTADTSSANLFHTDGLELENLTIQFDQAGGLTHGAVARVRGGATHCRIRNCTILGDTFYPDPNTLERATYVVHLAGDAGEIIDDVEVSDCEIRSVAYVTLKTNSTESATRSLRQSRNILIDCYREPLGLNSPGGDCDLVVVTENIVRDFNGAATSDSLVIGFAGCRKVVCSSNILEADARIFIYCEEACRDVVIADNVCVGNPSVASETGQVGIGVNPNDTTGTMERTRNITVTGNVLRNTGPRAGIGIWFWDFKTGTEEFAVDGANVQGNLVEGYDTGYRVMVENDNPVSVQGNIARDCTIGFAENHGAAARYESNVSAGCTYGVAARRGGVFDNHRFVGCDEIAGVFVQGSTLLIRTFTVVWPDRDYDAAEMVDHELFPVSSVTRALGAATGTLQNHSSGPSVVRHLLENISLTSHTPTKTGGISYGFGTPEAEFVVAASKLVFRAGVTNATTRVRVSVKFEGTAFFRPSTME